MLTLCGVARSQADCVAQIHREYCGMSWPTDRASEGNQPRVCRRIGLMVFGFVRIKSSYHFWIRGRCRELSKVCKPCSWPALHPEKRKRRKRTKKQRPDNGEPRITFFPGAPSLAPSSRPLSPTSKQPAPDVLSSFRSLCRPIRAQGLHALAKTAPYMHGRYPVSDRILSAKMLSIYPHIPGLRFCERYASPRPVIGCETEYEEAGSGRPCAMFHDGLLALREAASKV